MLTWVDHSDHIITLWVNRSAQWPWVHNTMVLLSESSTWVICGAVLFAYLFGRDRRLAFTVALTVLTGLALSDATCTYLLKPFFERIRPCHSLSPIVHAGCGGLYGFPSNHAANGMTIALLLRHTLGGRTGIVALLVVLCVGLSRVHLGAHFVGDVLGGYSVGVLVAWIVAQFTTRLPIYSRAQ